MTQETPTNDTVVLAYHYPYYADKAMADSTSDAVFRWKVFFTKDAVTSAIVSCTFEPQTILVTCTRAAADDPEMLGKINRRIHRAVCAIKDLGAPELQQPQRRS